MSSRSAEDYYSDKNEEFQNICNLERGRCASETGPIFPDAIAKMRVALDLSVDPVGATDPVAPTADIAPVCARSKKVTKVGSGPRSKKVTKRTRRTDSRDRQTLKKIQHFRVPAELAGWPSLVSDFTPPTSTHRTVDSDESKSRSKDVHFDANDYALPVWEHSKDRIKLAASTLALHVTKKPPVSWSVNLTPERIDEALRHADGFTECIAGYLKRAFERELLSSATLFLFSVDVTNEPARRLHLHGATAADEQELDALERALRHAGGHGPKPDDDDHMVDMNPRRCDEGWVTYAMRNQAKVRKAISGKGRTNFITGPLRSEGKGFYDEVRKIMKAARKYPRPEVAASTSP
jgi:hypothetical protein